MLLGCIGDDFTGSSDLANTLAKQGMHTVQYSGIPVIDAAKDVEAGVVSLKSRSIPVDEAIRLSLEALQWLKKQGCEQFFFKYCSTFDSTAQGNIGPVIDALMDDLGVKSTIICPALPVNGRTVYQGQLFVFDQLLHESPMKDHPLTPMNDSSIIRMIETQGQGKAISIPYNIIDQGQTAISQALVDGSKHHKYLVLDAINEQHLKSIGKCLKDYKLITGGSGLALDLCHEFISSGGAKSNAKDAIKPINAPSLVLSGSCSAMTQKQVSEYSREHPMLQLDVEKLTTGEQNLETILMWLTSVKNEAPIITATAAPEEISHNQEKFGADYIADLIEKTLSSVAVAAKDTLNFRNFVVAGGETSGAIVNALKADSFYIGKTIAPGVPMVQTTGITPLNLALKSGNFGDPNFFNKAIETLSCC